MLKDIFRELFRKSLTAAMLIEVASDYFGVLEVTDSYLQLMGLNNRLISSNSTPNTLAHLIADEKSYNLILDQLTEAKHSKQVSSFSFFHENQGREFTCIVEPYHAAGQDFSFIVVSFSLVTVQNSQSLVEKTELPEDELINKRFNHLIQDGLDMIAILDDAGNYKYVGNTSLSVLGFEPEYFIGRNAFEFIHPDDAEQAVIALSSIAGKSRVFLQPFRFLHRDGSWRWIETILTDLRKEPTVNGIVANSRDVTDQIDARNNVLLTNERLRYVTKASSEAIWDWDIATGSLSWGEGFTKFGYQADEMEATIQSWYAKIHPDDLDRVLQSIHLVIDNKETNWFDEYRLLNADASYSFVADKGFVIFDKNGVALRMVGAMQDVTKTKKEEQHLKLLESVVLNTTDSVAIMEVDPEKFPISEIVYVNEAFCKMSGYSYDELIGNSPRMLEGSRTDQEELKGLIQKLLMGLPGEATLINYRKNGEEFWLNLSVTPIADDKGQFNRWISIQRDVTQLKVEAVRQSLLSGISVLFNDPADLKKTAASVLDEISKCGNFCTAELWLPDANEIKLKLFARSEVDERMERFYEETADLMVCKRGEGLAGRVWHEMKAEDTSISGIKVEGKRIPAAINAGIKHVYGLPLIYNGKLVGVLVLALRASHKLEGMAILSDNFSEFLAGEIKRKLLEQELGEVFEFAPDILATLDYDGYFKRINPAAADLLGYSEAELLKKPAQYFVHPADRFATIRMIKKLSRGDKAMSFENRYLTKSGQVKWLSWTANAVSVDGLIFAVAKDITEKKMLADLLHKTNSLARIGSWEINVVDGTVFWSDVTKEIREAELDFQPDLDTGIHYFRDGKDKDTIKAKVQACMMHGTPWDEELEIETFKGNFKWIRTIGQAEMVDGKCFRIFGSFQDIDARKRAELLNSEILAEVAESEKRYSELFHFSPLPMWVYDLNTLYFLDVNLAAIRNYGYSREEFLSMTIRDIRPEAEIPALEQALEQIRSGQLLYNRTVYSHQTKDGNIIKIDIRSTPMLFKGRDAKLIVASDITKELLYIDAIEEKNTRLEEIAWIQSHTVRAPLARIMALVDMLGNEAKQNVITKEDIQKHIQTSAAELDSIIREITAMSDKTNL